MKSNKGITLIALVITIIVLLILAGVAISLVFGENGMITKSMQSKEISEKADADEKIKLVIADWQIEKHTGDKTITEFLDEKKTNKEIDGWTDNGDGTYEIEINGYVATIDENGNIIVETEKIGPRPSVSNIKVVTNSDGTGEQVKSGTQSHGTTLYISFETSMKDGTITSVTYNNTAVSKNQNLWVTPVTENGIYAFTIVGTKDGIEYAKTLSIKVDQYGLRVGEYVDYTPDNADPYSSTKLANTITGSTSNLSDISQDTLNWQILRIYDDGRIDLIGSPTSQSIYFNGASGYNNGVYIMNDICKELYSKDSKGITARSIKYEDLESWLTSFGESVRDTYKTTTVAYGVSRLFCNIIC